MHITMTGQDDVELLSDEVQEMMGKMPPFVVRWGSSFVFLVLCLCMGAMLLIEYPDTITAPVMISNLHGQQPSVMMKCAVNGSGSIRPGQNVYVKVDNYPSYEFGVLAGKVRDISPDVTTDSAGTYYRVHVSLNKGLVSDYNKTLSFYRQMHGTADIIIKKTTLFERIVRPLLQY